MLLIDALLLSILTLQSDLLLQKKALCDDGDMDSCAQLAIAYELGYYGAERDLQLAAKLNQIACAGGVGPACLRLSFAPQTGAGCSEMPPVLWS